MPTHLHTAIEEFNEKPVGTAQGLYLPELSKFFSSSFNILLILRLPMPSSGRLPPREVGGSHLLPYLP